ncbi:hypothetical protein Tco_0356537 [Tanacetum coccineum]
MPSPTESTILFPIHPTEALFSVSTSEPVLSLQITRKPHKPTQFSATPTISTTTRLKQYPSFLTKKKEEMTTGHEDGVLDHRIVIHNLWNIGLIMETDRKKTGERSKRKFYDSNPPVCWLKNNIVVQERDKEQTYIASGLSEIICLDFHHLDDARDICHKPPMKVKCGEWCCLKYKGILLELRMMLAGSHYWDVVDDVF